MSAESFLNRKLTLQVQEVEVHPHGDEREGHPQLGDEEEDPPPDVLLEEEPQDGGEEVGDAHHNGGLLGVDGAVGLLERKKEKRKTLFGK